MPPFAAPRLDPFLHKSKMKGPLSITQCQAHEKAVPFHQRALQKIDIKKAADAPSLLCIIYTYKAHHTKNARTAAETWLPRCDGAVRDAARWCEATTHIIYMQQPFSLLHFECAAASNVSCVHVVGDHPALGCWDPTKSVPSAPTAGVENTDPPVL